ncbi:MAG: M56 family metallopeptidase [Colwellia sp.]|nr:M56 family metallopeptidase [Colwellia sp.]
MINHLVSLMVPLTLMLSLLLLIRAPLRKKADANTSYALWLLLPLSLILYPLELPWYYVSDLNNANIQSYLVQPSKQIQQQLSANNLMVLALTSLWLTGVFSLVFYWMATHFNFKKSLKIGILTKVTLSKSLNKIIPEKLTVKQSSHIHSPILMGLMKPTLLIPEDFNELYNPEQQALIINHEVCHYTHHHMWANQVALMLLALFWFHPLAWRAYAAFRQDQEHACDQVVLDQKRTKSRIQYCKALVLAAETSPPNAFTLMSFKHNGEQNFMFNRIEQIKNMSAKSKAYSTTKLALIVLLSTSTLAGISYAGNQVKQNNTLAQTQLGTQPTYRVEPKYPIKAAREGTEGSVVLKFDINGDGSVSNVEVVDGKPAYVFDKTAIVAVKQWRYQATGQAQKNTLVQLDYLMGKSSVQPESLIERIKVVN